MPPVDGAVVVSQVDLVQSADEIVGWLVAEDFGKVVATFDAKMTRSLSEAKLREAWDSVVKKDGAFKSRGEAVATRQGGYDVVVVPGAFENADYTVKVVYDKAGKVSGLWIN